MPGCSPAKDEGCLSEASHLVKKPEVLDEIRRLVELSVTDFRAVLQCLGKHLALVNLTIVLTHLPLIEVDTSSTSIQIPRDAVGSDAMRLGESQCDARVFRQIAVGVLDRQVRMCLANAIEHRPTHDAHEGFRPERLTALDLQLDLPCVIGLVAGLAERYQVVGRIPAGLTAFEVVHVEDLVLRTTVTVLANVTVPKENVFTHVPKAELIALLIVRAFNRRILDLLNVERCRLNHDLGDGKQSADRIDARHVRLNAVFNGRCKPALVFRSDTVQKARRTVARLALAALTTQREPGSQKPRDVLSKFDFGRKDLFLFRRSGKADMLCACINAQRHVLLRFTGGDSKLNREWRSTLHHGFSSLEQMPRLCRRARHQGLTAHVQNKYFQSISFADTRRFRLHGPKAGLTSFAYVGRGFLPATPLLPLRAFNRRPQCI